MSDVSRFHAAAGVFDPEHLQLSPGAHVIDLRTSLIIEEVVDELLPSMQNLKTDPGAVVDVADGIADAIFVLVGTALSLGIPLDRVWDEVTRSNMDKFREGVVVRSDGKIMKPADWKAPDIAGALGLISR